MSCKEEPAQRQLKKNAAKEVKMDLPHSQDKEIVPSFCRLILVFVDNFQSRICRRRVREGKYVRLGKVRNRMQTGYL